MIPKSGGRFSDQIMRKQKMKKAAHRNAPLSPVPERAWLLAADVAGRRAALPDLLLAVLLAGARARRRRFEFGGCGRVAMIDAEHAFDAADHAADGGSDHRADRTRDAPALVKSMSRATRHALRLRRHRRAGKCEKYARKYNSSFHHSSSCAWEARAMVANRGHTVTMSRREHEAHEALCARNEFRMIKRTATTLR
jgi:hypothetical protein